MPLFHLKINTVTKKINAISTEYQHDFNQSKTFIQCWYLMYQRHTCSINVASTFTCNQNSTLFKPWKMTLKKRNNFNVASTFTCNQNSTFFKRSSMTLKQRWLNLKMPAGYKFINFNCIWILDCILFTVIENLL